MKKVKTTDIIGRINAAIEFADRGMLESATTLLNQVMDEIKESQTENALLKETIRRYEQCQGSYDPTMLHQALRDEELKAKFTNYQV